MTGTDIYEVSEAPRQPAGAGGDIMGKPSLLDLAKTNPADVVKTMMEEWDASHKHVRGFIAQWKVNVAREKGYTGVRLVKQQDEQRAHIPVTAVPNMAAMNQAARLKRRVRAIMFADPPILEATPSTDEDEDRDNAEFATRVLADVCDEGNLSYRLKASDAFDCASSYGSGFIHFSIDPQGGGWRPREIVASPLATSAQHPLTNPASGQPWARPDGTAPPFHRRFVRADGTLTDQRADPQVARQWLPKIRDDELDGRHVRFIPSSSRDLWEAEGVQIGVMVPLGVVKGLFPKLARLPEEKLAAIIAARPDNVRDLLPRHRRDADAKVSDDTMVFVLSRYHRQCAAYPKGAYLVAVGDDTLLHAQDWWDETNGEPLDIPLTQFPQFREKDNPYSLGLMELLGPGNELRAYLFGFVLEHLERFASRKTFLPMHSNLQPEQLQAPTATVLNILPNGEPKYEDVPDLPTVVKDLFEAVKLDLNDESGLQQQAQGVNVPSVKSGLHAQTIIEQTIQALSDLRQNTERGFVRGGRIILQLIRARYTVPQMVKWVGEDGAYKQAEFIGADLGSTRDVRLNKGSFTQLAPSNKAALAEQFFAIRDPQTGEALLNLDELRSVVSGNVGGLLGVQDNPHLQRVRRQVSQWRQGPPDNWQAVVPTIDPTTGQLVQLPDPALSFLAPVPADDEPQVARLRAYELGRAIASTRYLRWDPAWSQALGQVYLAMRKAAGIVTVADQEAAAAAQAQAQQQAVAVQQQQQAAAQADAQGAAVQAAEAQAVRDRALIEQLIRASQQGDAAVVQQTAALLRGHTADVAAVVAPLGEAIAAQANAPPPPLAPVMPPAPMTVNIPAQDQQNVVFDQIGAALAQLSTALNALAASQANRPTSFAVERDAKGRVDGVRATTPEGTS